MIKKNRNKKFLNNKLRKEFKNKIGKRILTKHLSMHLSKLILKILSNQIRGLSLCSEVPEMDYTKFYMILNQIKVSIIGVMIDYFHNQKNFYSQLSLFQGHQSMMFGQQLFFYILQKELKINVLICAQHSKKKDLNCLEGYLKTIVLN